MSSGESFDISINYAEVQRLQRKMEALKKQADEIYLEYDNISTSLKNNWQSREAEYLLDQNNLRTFYDNIAIIRDNIDAVHKWCTNTMADFDRTSYDNATKISNVMAYK